MKGFYNVEVMYEFLEHMKSKREVKILARECKKLVGEVPYV